MHKEELNEKYLENILKILRYHTIYTRYNNEKFDSYLDFFSFLYYLILSYKKKQYISLFSFFSMIYYLFGKSI